MKYRFELLAVLLLVPAASLGNEISQKVDRDSDSETLRVFIFAGQSNKFTHSGSQINDWTPKGTDAKDRNLYLPLIGFIQNSIEELQEKGHQVELAGIFYHVGENDMSFVPYRREASKWLQSTVAQSRLDLAIPSLRWYVSQQPPTDGKELNAIDVTANLAAIADSDPAFIHLKAFNLPPQNEGLVITTAGIVQLGELLAECYLEHR